jgi:serine/threonine protein kinase
MTTESTESNAEQAAVRHAVTRGYLQPAQLQEAVRLRDQTRARGKPAQLVAILSTRFLTPEQAQEVHAVYHHHRGGSDMGSMAGGTDGRGGPGGTVQLPPRRPSDRLPAAAPPSDSGPVSRETGLAQSGPQTATLRRSGSGSGALESIGGYRILKELARGGMGVVYVAQKQGLERKVALKILLNAELAAVEDVERFRIEAEATARLKHEGIVTVYDVGQDAGRPFIVMELVEGESLKAKLLRDGPMTPREAAQVTQKLARAMFYAHKRHILHRDLKPSNVLIGVDGEPKITDFGLAKDMRKSEDGERGLTMTGDVMGTPAYMPPEQATGELDHIDRRSDVYSLGATLYEMLTGKPPFEGSTPMRILSSVMVDEPTPPSMLRPNLSEDLETICLKCLEKRPEDRYLSARALAEDLENYLKKRPIRARPPTVRDQVDKWLQRNRGLTKAISAVLLLLGLGSVGVAYWLGGQREREDAVRLAAAAEAGGEAKAEMVAGAAEATREATVAFQQAKQLEARLQAALDLLQAASRWDALANGDQAGPQNAEAREAAHQALERLGETAFEARQLALAAAAYRQLPEARADLPLRRVDHVKRTIALLDEAAASGIAFADHVEGAVSEIAAAFPEVTGPLLLERLEAATREIRAEREMLLLSYASRLGADREGVRRALAEEASRPVEERLLHLEAIDPLGRLMATMADPKGPTEAFDDFGRMMSPGPRLESAICMSALARLQIEDDAFAAGGGLGVRTAVLECAEALWVASRVSHILEALERYGGLELYERAVAARVDGSYFAGARPLAPPRPTGAEPGPDPRPQPRQPALTVDEWFQVVDRALDGGDANAALRATDQALEQHPGQLELLLERVIIFGKVKDYRAALGACEEALRHHPDHWAVYKNRAVTYAMAGDDRAALADLQRVLAQQPGELHSLMTRGLILSSGELRDPAAARRDFEEFLRLAPADDPRRERVEQALARLR